MKGRKEEVAKLAGVGIADVHPASVDDVRHVYADSAAAIVVEVATQQAVLYWRVRNRYYLDDPEFGGSA